MSNRLLSLILLTAAGCAQLGPTNKASVPAAVDTQLKVVSGVGVLKAKLMLKNLSAREVILPEVNSRNFKVETVKGEPMALKEGAGAGQLVKLPPGGSAETSFSLQDNYKFWDRRTKYRIWYDSPEIKSNVVQVWF